MAAGNYFNEKEVAQKILEYQQIVETIKDEKGHKVVVNKTPYIEKLETDITLEVLKIVKAVIFLYRYDRYMEYSELESLGIQACFQNYLKFDPQYGSAFNFFSLIVKKCLYGLTTRNSKKREKNVYLEDLGDAVHASRELNLEEFVDNLKASLHEIIDENFLSKKRKRYILISDTICDYLKKTKSYISKTDMYRFCGNYSLRASDIRQYVHDLKPYYNNFAAIIDDDEDTKDTDDAKTSTGGIVEE